MILKVYTYVYIYIQTQKCNHHAMFSVTSTVLTVLAIMDRIKQILKIIYYISHLYFNPSNMSIDGAIYARN